MTLEEEIQIVGLKAGARVVGIAAAEAFRGDRVPEGYRPEDALPGARSVVVAGGDGPTAGAWRCADRRAMEITGDGLRENVAIHVMADCIEQELGLLDSPSMVSLDAALLQHCTMNVPDKGRLFGEGARVLRMGGVLALHEWVKLGGGPVILPVRWADTPEIDFIATREEFEGLLAEAGFVRVEQRDVSDEGRRWREVQAAGAESERARLLFTNMARNLAETRAACLMAVWRKP